MSPPRTIRFAGALVVIPWAERVQAAGWRTLLVGKRGQMPSLPEGTARTSDLRPQQRPDIVMSMSETQRSKGNPSVPETPSTRPPQNSPASVLPDLPVFVGINRKSCKVSARCTAMGNESACSTENYKTLRMTKSSLHTSPIVLVHGKGSPVISKDRSFRARAARSCRR